jgi:hypothetical protein
MQYYRIYVRLKSGGQVTAGEAAGVVAPLSSRSPFSGDLGHIVSVIRQ